MRGSCFWFCASVHSSSSPSVLVNTQSLTLNLVTHNFLTHTRKLSHNTLITHTHSFVTHNLSHTPLSHTIFHTHTHTTLSNTILHTQLCDTPSFSHTFSLHGRHGAWQHRCLFCLAGVALIGTGLVWLHAGPCLDSTLFFCGRSGTYSFPDLSFVWHFGLCGRLGTCCLLTSTFVFSWQVWYGTYL